MDLRDITEFVKDIIRYIFVIVVAILIFIYVLSIQQVVGPSMNSTLHENDVIFVNKFVYRFGDVARGDVVVFEYDGMKNLVKRVIGLPGEYVEYRDNKLYIDGVGYKEDYLDTTTVTDNWSITSLGVDKIPEGYYLLLGDNRGNSMDSREIGLVSIDSIIGKVGLRVYPFNAIELIR